MSNKTSRSNLNGVVERHANMRVYLQHRQRVLNAAPRVDTRQPRAKSAPRLYTPKEETQLQQRRDENLRLLKSLVTISQRQSELGSSGRNKSCSRSSTSSASTANYSRNSIQR